MRQSHLSQALLKELTTSKALSDNIAAQTQTQTKTQTQEPAHSHNPRLPSSRYVDASDLDAGIRCKNLASNSPQKVRARKRKGRRKDSVSSISIAHCNGQPPQISTPDPTLMPFYPPPP